jgi:hypothetical protein
VKSVVWQSTLVALLLGAEDELWTEADEVVVKVEGLLEDPLELLEHADRARAATAAALKATYVLRFIPI